MRFAQAHPRSRGDHMESPLKSQASLGSSPLARGPPLLANGDVWPHGLIPARAGTTAGGGGNDAGDMGSSPLARGPPGPVCFRRFAPGLIPARAGTTLQPYPELGKSGAHPRSRGDHSQSRVSVRGLQGSSPLARGPQFGGAFTLCVQGLIPARAGTTAAGDRLHHILRAHPRSRGDHGVLGRARDGVAGSSPLARGPPHDTRSVAPHLGLIPARAGTTRRTTTR